MSAILDELEGLEEREVEEMREGWDVEKLLTKIV